MKYSAIIAQLATDLSNAETEIAELKEDLQFEHNEAVRLRNQVFELQSQLRAKVRQLESENAELRIKLADTDPDPAARATAYMMREGATLWNGKRVGLIRNLMRITNWRIEPAMNWAASFMDAYECAPSIPVAVDEPIPETKRSYERMTA